MTEQSYAVTRREAELRDALDRAQSSRQRYEDQLKDVLANLRHAASYEIVAQAKLEVYLERKARER